MNQPANQTIIKRGDFYDTLAAIDRGGLVHELEEAFREVVLAAVHAMKKGKVTLEVTFNPDLQSEAMRVSARVKKQLPPEPVKASIFFATPEGNLSRMDLRQREMFPEPGQQQVTTITHAQSPAGEKVDEYGVVTSSDQL